MKVEYSYHGNSPILIIKGTDFVKALKDKDECYLLEIATVSYTHLTLPTIRLV